MSVFLLERNASIRLIALVTLAGLSGCDQEIPIVEPPAPLSMAQYVSGAAANALLDDGTFRLGSPLDSQQQQLSPELAGTLADAFQRNELFAYADYIEETRGAGVHFRSLKRCGRIYYAESTLEALPMEVSPAIRRAYGPHWIVSYCGRAAQREVVVAVSALASELQIKDGRIVYPPFHGGSFFRATGIPKEIGDTGWGTPEVAARTVAVQAGRRVTAVPRLVTPAGMAPETSFWMIEIDQPLAVRGKYSRVQSATSRIFFTDDPRWGHIKWIPKVGPGNTFRYQWPVPSTQRRTRATFRTGFAGTRSGYPVQIEPMEASER